jgi:hypothetical protein
MTVQLSIQHWETFMSSSLLKSVLGQWRTSVCIVKMVTTMVIYSIESLRDLWFKLAILQVKYVYSTFQEHQLVSYAFHNFPLHIWWNIQRHTWVLKTFMAVLYEYHMLLMTNSMEHSSSGVVLAAFMEPRSFIAVFVRVCPKPSDYNLHIHTIFLLRSTSYTAIMPRSPMLLLPFRFPD